MVSKRALLAKIGSFRKKVADFTYYLFTIHSSLKPMDRFWSK